MGLDICVKAEVSLEFYVFYHATYYFMDNHNFVSETVSASCDSST